MPQINMAKVTALSPEQEDSVRMAITLAQTAPDISQKLWGAMCELATRYAAARAHFPSSGSNDGVGVITTLDDIPTVIHHLRKASEALDGVASELLEELLREGWID